MDEFTIKSESKDDILIKCEKIYDYPVDREEGEIIEAETNENFIDISCENKDNIKNQNQTRTGYYTEFQGYTRKMLNGRYQSRFLMNNRSTGVHNHRYFNHKLQHNETFDNQRSMRNFSNNYETCDYHTYNQRNINFQNARSHAKFAPYYENLMTRRIPLINQKFYNQHQNRKTRFQKTFNPSSNQNRVTDPTKNVKNSSINAEIFTKTFFNNTSNENSELMNENEKVEKRPSKIQINSDQNDEIQSINFSNNECIEISQTIVSDTLSNCSVTVKLYKPLSIGEIIKIMEKHETRVKEFKWLNDKYQTACVTYFDRNIALQIYQQFLKKEPLFTV